MRLLKKGERVRIYEKSGVLKGTVNWDQFGDQVNVEVDFEGDDLFYRRQLVPLKKFTPKRLWVKYEDDVLEFVSETPVDGYIEFKETR